MYSYHSPPPSGQSGRFTPAYLFLTLLLITTGCHGTTTSGPSDNSCSESQIYKDGECLTKCQNETECSSLQVCKENVCVNVACKKDDDCAVGRCSAENTCVPYTRCTNNSSCSNEETCYGGFCRTSDEICNVLQCNSKRGVCNPKKGICDNATDCDGDLNKCLDGFYCSALNVCEEIQCEDDGTCNSGGVCNPAKKNGCSNKEPCEKKKDCVAGSICQDIDGEDNKCLVEKEVCSTVCGKQGCEFDKNSDGAVKVTCVDQPACTNALNCTADKHCIPTNPKDEYGTCQTRVACRADKLEENNDYKKASPLGEAPLKNLSLCTDEDWYTYTASKTGTLVISLDIERFDVGVKPVSLQLYKASSTAGTPPTPVGAPVTNQETSRILVTQENVTTGEVYYIKAFTDDTQSNRHLEYSLQADVLPTTLISACKTVPEVKLGTILKGDSTKATPLLAPSCGGTAGETIIDFVWHLHVPKRQVYTIAAKPAAEDADPIIDIRKTCALDASSLEAGCYNNAGAGQEETLSRTLDKGDYYIVVSFADTKTSDIELSVQAQEVACTSANNRCINNDTELEYCNETQTALQTKKCNCSNGTCADGAGDSCLFAIPVTKESPYENLNLDLTALTNTYDGRDACGTTVGHTNGGDLVLVGTVPPGHVFVTEARGEGYLSINYVTDCTNFANSCLKGHFSGVGDYNHQDQIFWRNTTNKTQTVYAIIDHQTPKSGKGPISAKVKASITEEKCEPLSGLCNADREVLVCNIYGTNRDQRIPCSNGCENGACKIKPGDRCSDAPPLKIGSQIVDLIHYKDDYLDPSSCGTIRATPQGGKEAVFKLEAKKDYIYTLKAKANASNLNPRIWISSSCDPDGSVGSCINGSDQHTDSTEETLKFLSGSAQTYYVIVEGASGDQKGSITLEAEEVEAAGKPGKIKECKNEKIIYYDQWGEEKEKDCTSKGGCTDTIACNNGDGDTCFEAILAENGKTYSGKLTNITPEIPLFKNAVDNCYFTSPPHAKAKDLIYRIKVEQEKTLVINMTTLGQDAYAFLQKECGSENSCLDNIKRTGKGTLTYKAGNEDEWVYLVMKKDSQRSFGPATEYSFTVNIEDKTCAPNTTSCKDPSTLTICNEAGTEQKEYTCPNGCEGGACKPGSNSGKGCGQAIDAGAGGVFFATPASNEQGNFTSGASPKCKVGYTDAGPDRLYSITTTRDNQQVTVSAAPLRTGNISVYLSTECVENMGPVCLKGEKSGARFENPAKVSYFVEKAGTTLYIVIDQGFSYSPVIPAYVTIDLEEGGCSGNFPACEGNKIKICEQGEIKEIECGSSSCTSTPSPTCNNIGISNGNSCFDAIELVHSGPSSSSYAFPPYPPQRLSSTVSYDTVTKAAGKTEISGGCLFNAITPPIGPEKYYVLKQKDLEEGDIVKVSVKSNSASADDNLRVYLQRGCHTDAECISSSTLTTGTRVIEWTVPKSKEDYYIVVDSIKASATSNPWNILWEITRPTNKSCVPFQGTCEGDKLVQCLSNGKITELECPAGCEHGRCIIPAETNVCGSALTVENGFSGIIPFRDGSFTNTLDLPENNQCIPWKTQGTDAFFKVNVPEQTTLKVSAYRAAPAESTALYFFKNCNDLDYTCIPNTGGIMGSQTEDGPLTYGAYHSGRESGEIYFGVDSNSKYDNHAQRIYVELTPYECNPYEKPDAPNQQTCNAAKDKLTYCSPLGEKNEHSCTCLETDGVATCDSPKGTACYDAKPLDLSTDSVEEQGTFDQKNKNYSLPVGNKCTKSITPGPERVYSVKMTAGQKLTASLQSNTTNPEDVAIYLVSNCNDVPLTCLGEPTGDKHYIYKPGTTELADAEEVSYTATGEETIYIIVDSPDAEASHEFTLKATLEN